MLLNYLVMVILIIVILLLIYLVLKPCHILYITNSKQKKDNSILLFFNLYQTFCLTFLLLFGTEKMNKSN